MQQLIEIVGNVIFAKAFNIDGDVSIGTPLTITGNLIIGSGGADYPYYEGEYVVIPKVYEQSLDTDNKILTDDVVVKEITYNITPNEKGLTATIG